MYFIQFLENLDAHLLAHGFQGVKTPSGARAEGLYVRVENPVLYILGVCQTHNREQRQPMQADLALAMADRLEEMYCRHVVCLSIVLTEGTEEPQEPQEPQGWHPVTDERIHTVEWMFSVERGQLAAAKGDPDKLIGIEKLLRQAVAGEQAAKPLKMEIPQGRPWVCIGIFLVCALLLLVTTLSPQGIAIISRFGLSRGGILQGQYDRFFTSMFLHGGVMHLLSNSIYLYYFGTRLERLLGRGRFLTLYLVAGLCGGVASVLCHNVLAIGASGAIYGLLGAMLYLTKKRGSAYSGMNYATMLVLAFVSISFGFLDMGVDNFAHIGGFLGGTTLFFLFLRGMERKSTEN